MHQLKWFWKFATSTTLSARLLTRPWGLCKFLREVRLLSTQDLEWIVMALPKNPSELTLGVYSKAGVSLGVADTAPVDIQKAYANHIFSDDDIQTDYGISQAYDINY